MGQKYNVAAPRPKQDGGTWWHNVGQAYKNDNGSISVFLNSMPLPDPEKDNRIHFLLFEDDGSRGGGSSGGSGSGSKSSSNRVSPAEAKKNAAKEKMKKDRKERSEEIDDEIPF